MKSLSVFCVFTIACVLSGCTNMPSQTVTPTPTHGPSATPRPTLQPTLTSTQTAMPTPHISWSGALKQVAAFTSSGGQWSPTANSYLYTLHDGDDGHFDDFIQLVMAPQFEPHTIATHFSYDDFSEWAPDGKTIYFHTFLPDDMNMDGRHLWSTDGAGNNPQIIARSWFETSGYHVEGWLDSQTVVISNYWGGLLGVSEYNITTGEAYAARAGIHGFVYRPQHRYIPVTSDSANADPRLMVMGEHFPHVEYMRAGGNLRLLPSYNNISIDYSISKFEDWLADTNKMLVFWGHMKEMYGEPLETNLLLWDVDKNSLRLLAPGGVGGNFSPDGKYLAYMTFGAAPLHQTTKPAPTPADNAKYLELLDMSMNKVILSLPSFSDTEYEDFIFKKHQFLQAKFSPNSRYLAFITPGKIESDGNNWHLNVKDNPEHVYIHVLDLQIKQVIWSALSYKDSQWLSWSPDSIHLSFQNQDENWFLYSTKSQLVTPITQDHGNIAISPEWSYDSRYLRFITCPPLDANSRSCKQTATVILDVTNGKP